MLLDNILTIKNKKVDIVANILDNDISPIICNNEHIKKENYHMKIFQWLFH